MLQTLNTLAGKISPHSGSESGRLINNNLISNNNNTYPTNDKFKKVKRKIFSSRYVPVKYISNTTNEKFVDVSCHSNVHNKDNEISHQIGSDLSKSEFQKKTIGKRKIIELRYPFLAMGIPSKFHLLRMDGGGDEDDIDEKSKSSDDTRATEDGYSMDTITLGQTTTKSESTALTQKYRTLSDISGKLEVAIKGKGPIWIKDLKEDMRARYYSIIADEEYILNQMEEYRDRNKMKKRMIAKQTKLINNDRKKKAKKPTLRKKYFYIKLRKPIKKQTESSVEGEIILSSLGEKPQKLDTKKDIQSQDADVIQAEEVPLAAHFEDELEESDICDDDEYISCPSETDPEKACDCNNVCTCNEYARFKIFMLKKRERDERKVQKEEERKIRQRDGHLWDIMYQLYCYSSLSEETSMDVSSTSDSSCGVIRECHCKNKICGCKEYRDYITYKLYQIRLRKIKRDIERAKKRGQLKKIIGRYYKEDEYIKRVKDFIKQYYVDENKSEKYCPCGIYDCLCEASPVKTVEFGGSEFSDKKDEVKNDNDNIDYYELLAKPSASSILKEPSVERRPSDSKRGRLKFEGIDMSKTTLDENDKSPNSRPNQLLIPPARSKDPCYAESEEDDIDTVDIYRKISLLFDQDENRSAFVPYEVGEDGRQEIRLRLVRHSHESLYGENSFSSFDYKTYLAKRHCDCEDYLKYFNFKKKVRRSVEKDDPCLKYFRKRITYLQNLEEVEKLLNNTSSETDDPLHVSLAEQCKKYSVAQDEGERRKKLIKKKNRKVEKKILLKMIKKGSHMHPCECIADKKTDEHWKPSASPCECEICYCPKKTLQKKQKGYKIEPSLPLESTCDKDLFEGETTFPDCEDCIEIYESKQKKEREEEIKRMKKKGQGDLGPPLSETKIKSEWISQPVPKTEESKFPTTEKPQVGKEEKPTKIVDKKEHVHHGSKLGSKKRKSSKRVGAKSKKGKSRKGKPGKAAKGKGGGKPKGGGKGKGGGKAKGAGKGKGGGDKAKSKKVGKSQKVERGKSEISEKGKSQKVETGKSQKVERGKSQKVERGKSQKVERGKSQKVERGKSQKVEKGKSQKVEKGKAPKGVRGKSQKGKKETKKEGKGGDNVMTGFGEKSGVSMGKQEINPSKGTVGSDCPKDCPPSGCPISNIDANVSLFHPKTVFKFGDIVL